MGRRAWATVGVALLIGGAAVAAAEAARTVAGPSASAMVLAATDVPGAKVTAQKAGKGTQLIDGAYEREFHFSRPYGASKFTDFVDVAILTKAVDIATADYAAAAHEYESAQGKKLLASLFAGLAKGVTTSKMTTRPIALGDKGLQLSFVAKVKSESMNVSVVLFRIDRVVEIASAEGTGQVGKQTDALALGNLIAAHVRAALMPSVVAAPTITGTDQQGQTIAASTGTWTNTPTSYTYQWQHCDAAGANCADIAGATAATYAVTAADVGTTLRVNVTAKNGVGSVAAPSAVTGVVT
jgi:hypothetical protein